MVRDSGENSCCGLYWRQCASYNCTLAFSTSPVQADGFVGGAPMRRGARLYIVVSARFFAGRLFCHRHRFHFAVFLRKLLLPCGPSSQRAIHWVHRVMQGFGRYIDTARNWCLLHDARSTSVCRTCLSQKCQLALRAHFWEV